MAGNIVDTFAQALGALKLTGSTIVGVDIGLSAVKCAEVTYDHKKNQFTLESYGTAPLAEGAIIEDEIQKDEEIIDAIQMAFENGQIKSKNVCVGVFGPNTVTKKLQLAGGSDEEIEDQAIWEAEQYLPFSVDDSTISYHVLGENEGGGVDVIVAGARNDVIESFKGIVEDAGYRVKIVDMAMTAIINVLEYVYEERLLLSEGSWLVLDLGAQKTEFIIYKGHTMVFSKEMNIGGVMITEEIQRQMGVNYLEAEDLKITGDENKNLPEEILEIVDEVVESFFAEIKKTYDFYVASSSDDSLENCVVTGGGALIPGLVEGLEALIGVRVEIMNPFERFEYNSNRISEDMIQEIAYKGVQVLGLGMRNKQ